MKFKRKKLLMLLVTIIGIIGFIFDNYVAYADNDYQDCYTIGDYCCCERRAYVKYRTYIFDTSIEKLNDMMDKAYWLVRSTKVYGIPTGKILTVGYEGETISAMIKENEAEWIASAYLGLDKDMPGSMDITYIDPEEFAKLDLENCDFSEYDFIIIEHSADEVEITTDQYRWLNQFTETSRYIIIDGDIVGDSVSWYSSENSSTSCAYNEAEQKLRVLASPFDKNYKADSKADVVEMYNKNLKWNPSDPDPEYDGIFPCSKVEEIRMYGGKNLPQYAFTPFEKLKAFMYLPDSGINSIGAHSFEGLNDLEYIDMSSVTSIGDYGMAGTGLVSIDGNNIVSIGGHAFENCKDLATISLNSLTTLGEAAFKDSGISEISIPNTVTVLPRQTFYGCEQLNCVRISVPDDGLTVYYDAFEDVPDDCRIIWDFGDGGSDAYILAPFGISSDNVTVKTINDYFDGSETSCTIKKGDKTLRQYTLTFDANGGECGISTIVVDKGDVYSNLPVPIREGYEFINWIDTDGNIYKNGEKVDIEKDVILIADWKKVEKKTEEKEEDAAEEKQEKTDNNGLTEKNTIWSFDTTDIAEKAHKEVRMISNTTLSMRPIYMLNSLNTGYYYSNGKKIDLKDKSFIVKDEENADFLLKTISSSEYDGKILWITSKTSYKKCKKNANNKDKTVINSGMSRDELARAITLMHCKYFQYLLYIQTPYTETEAKLNNYLKSNLQKDMMNVKDWENNITYPDKGDVYPVNTTIFNKYYSYCKVIDDALNNLLDTKFSFDMNTTVVDAILAINEYIMEETGFDHNPLNESYSPEPTNGKIQIDKDKWVDIVKDENGYIKEKTKSGSNYITHYVDNNGNAIDTYRIYDLKWFLTDTNDIRNPYKKEEKKHGVCQSYAKFVAAIMGKCGYEVKIVSGRDNDKKNVHVFNKIIIDNSEYYCDFTDGYNAINKPCKWLFLTKEEIEKKEDHHDPHERERYNGEKIIIGRESDYHNLTLNACSGRLVVKKNGYNFTTTYYEQIVKNNLRYTDALEDIFVHRNNYSFLGWYTSEYGGIKIKVNTVIDKNQKIFAHWKKIYIKKEIINEIKIINDALKIKYNKYAGVDNYQIQITQNRSFKKHYKEYLASGSQKHIITDKLDKGTYYVRVRAMKKDSCSKIIYGGWSRIQKVKVR